MLLFSHSLICDIYFILQRRKFEVYNYISKILLEWLSGLRFNSGPHLHPCVVSAALTADFCDGPCSEATFALTFLEDLLSRPAAHLLGRADGFCHWQCPRQALALTGQWWERHGVRTLSISSFCFCVSFCGYHLFSVLLFKNAWLTNSCSLGFLFIYLNDIYIHLKNNSCSLLCLFICVCVFQVKLHTRKKLGFAFPLE